MNLKARIASGAPLLGTFLKTPHPHVVEVLGGCGFDLLCLDAEHAPFDRGDIDACVAAARAVKLPIVVRVPDSAPHGILNALDCGADGVVVPHIRTVAEARAVALAARYTTGGRGYAGSSRAAGYGSVGMQDHRAASARRTVVIAQIEDAEAVEAIDGIATVDGIDALFIGRIDLTIALGCTSPDDPVVVAACDCVVAAAVAAGRPVGMFLSRPADAPLWTAKGVTLFLLGSDHSLLRSGATALRRESGLTAPATQDVAEQGRTSTMAPVPRDPA